MHHLVHPSLSFFPSPLPDAIRERTTAHLQKLGGVSVSAKPIILRVEFAYCPNLTVIDTPGFILKARAGEPEDTPAAILAMVKALAAPPHRLLLFLQQSSVEWCSALWLHVVQEVDPTLSRTVLVASKFDNRMKCARARGTRARRGGGEGGRGQEELRMKHAASLSLSLFLYTSLSFSTRTPSPPHL